MFVFIIFYQNVINCADFVAFSFRLTSPVPFIFQPFVSLLESTAHNPAISHPIFFLYHPVHLEILPSDCWSKMVANSITCCSLIGCFSGVSGVFSVLTVSLAQIQPHSGIVPEQFSTHGRVWPFLQHLTRHSRTDGWTPGPHHSSSTDAPRHAVCSS